MTEQRKRQQLALDRLETTASFAKTTLNKLSQIQESLYGIGEDDAAQEVDDLIDEQNAVWMALDRIKNDIAREIHATTKGIA